MYFFFFQFQYCVLSLSLRATTPALAAEDNLYLLGSTSPNASVTIKGTNTTTDAPLILKTITADEKSIFKTSMFVSTDSIYAFTISAKNKPADLFFIGEPFFESDAGAFPANYAILRLKCKKCLQVRDNGGIIIV